MFMRVNSQLKQPKTYFSHNYLIAPNVTYLYLIFSVHINQGYCGYYVMKHMHAIIYAKLVTREEIKKIHSNILII